MKHLFSLLIFLAFVLPNASAAFTPELLERAAACDTAVQYELGMCYLKGNGIKKSSKEAFKWFTAAGEAGHSEALYRSGLLYFEGHGTKKNLTKAVECFQKGAESGNQNCRNAYAVCLYNGTGIEKDSINAVKTWEELADEGCSEAIINLGKMFYFNDNYTAALPYLFRACEKNSPIAMFLIGECYRYGRGIDADRVIAVDYYRKAAELSYADAQFELGYCYWMGIGGLPQSIRIARKYWQRAANQGHEEAAEKLIKVDY